MPLMYPLAEFCREHRISRSGFYNLRDKGQAPRITMIGRKVMISAEDAAAWRAKMAAETAANAEQRKAAA